MYMVNLLLAGSITLSTFGLFPPFFYHRVDPADQTRSFHLWFVSPPASEQGAYNHVVRFCCYCLCIGLWWDITRMVISGGVA